MEDVFGLSDNEKNDVSYKACMASTTITGLAMGGFIGGVGAPVGFGAGLVIGLLTCKKLSPAVKMKLFSKTTSLTEGDMLSFVNEIRSLKPMTSKLEAVKMLASIQSEIIKTPKAYKQYV